MAGMNPTLQKPDVLTGIAIMNSLVQLLWPEMVLTVAACVLFLLGVSRRVAVRRLSALLAVLTLAGVFFGLLASGAGGVLMGGQAVADPWHSVRIVEFGYYIKILVAGVGILLALLAWPGNRQATGNSAMDVGQDTGEFFGLMLLSLMGVFLVASSNDMILMFLGIELASIPTYIMVAISRPLAVAQEAGVKYFFLGAMAAALMLFGFSYLYGTTGTTDLHRIGQIFAAGAGGVGNAPVLSAWQILAVVMLMMGFAFKMAVVPLHFYAGDVYQGAATPVTALLSFVPKISGFVALIKILFVVGGGSWVVPEFVTRILIVLSVLTMCVGNVLGLLQFNIKRVLAYSSIAHSGYMLVGLAALTRSRMAGSDEGLSAVLFYLAGYGIMNVAAFGVLMLLPARPGIAGMGGVGTGGRMPPATSAETFEDIAGQGRKHVALGLAMAVACFSLIGLPLTVGFFGKLYLIRAAFNQGMTALVVIMVINAAISAAYYLRIVAAMFLRPEPQTQWPRDARPADDSAGSGTMPIKLAVGLSVFGVLLFGLVVPAIEMLSTQARSASRVDVPTTIEQPAATASASMVR